MQMGGGRLRASLTPGASGSLGLGAGWSGDKHTGAPAPPPVDTVGRPVPRGPSTSLSPSQGASSCDFSHKLGLSCLNKTPF